MKNKIIKLPIFLGAVVAICGTLLALVYSFTNPIIEAATEAKANAAYATMYAEYNVTGADFKAEDVTNITGCSKRAIVDTEAVKGICYTCSASGFGGTFSFQVAFANGEYLGYNDLGNSETSGYGATLIAGVNDVIKGISSSEKLSENSSYKSYQSGKSVTGSALSSVVENCRVDYMAWYEGK